MTITARGQALLLTAAAVLGVTAVFAKATAVGPILLVLSARYGLGVHTGDLLALLTTSALAAGIHGIAHLGRATAGPLRVYTTS